MTVGYATTCEVTAINRDLARPGRQYFADGFWEAGEIAEGADR